MSNIPIDPGYAIGSIATASGTEIVATALGVAAVLGNVASPKSVIVGPIGEEIVPGFHLVVAGGHCPHWYQAQKLMLDPVESCQRYFRELSGAVKSERIQHAENHRNHLEATDQLIDLHEEDVFKVGKAAMWVQPYAALRRPTFCLRNPTQAAFEAAQSEVLDERLFIYAPDGGFLSNLPAPHLLAVLNGCDAAVGTLGLGRLRLARAYLLETVQRSELVGIVNEGNALHILQQCWILDEPKAVSKQVPLELSRTGYLAYNNALRLILDCRRKGEGPFPRVAPQTWVDLEAYAHEIRTWLGALPPGFGQYFRNALSLPYQLLWAFLLVVAPGESPQWCLPLAKRATQVLLERQRKILEDVFAQAHQARVKHVQLTMLRKLLERPCKRRELLRRYPVQRKELHEPVLMELITAGLVAEHPGGVLEVSAAGKAQLT